MTIHLRRNRRATRASLAVLASLSLLASRSALADDDPISTRRATVERAEEEIRLREREVALDERDRALHERSTSRPSDAPTPFSRRGRIVLPELAGLTSYAVLGAPALVGGLSASGLFVYGMSSHETPAGRVTTSSLAFRPAADVFVTDHWTVGLTADVVRFTSVSVGADTNQRAFSADNTGYSIAGAPRIGRTFEVGPVTVWPKVAFGYGVSRSEQDADPYQPASRTLSRTISSRLALDIVLPLSKHVLFSVGPSLSYIHSDVTNNATFRPFGDSDGVVAGVQTHLGLTLP